MSRRNGKNRRKPEPEQTFAIVGEYITLGQLLKVAGVLMSGGEVKGYLEENCVLINGEQDTRRGRKLYPGDVILTPGMVPLRLTQEDAEVEEESL